MAVSGKSTVVIADTEDKIPRSPLNGGITTVYWNICGLGQPIRYALEVAGVAYSDVRVQPGPGEPGTAEYRGLWMGNKRRLGEDVPFPNLPYFFDGDVKLVQTNAILKYIGRKYDLLGDTDAAHMVDMVMDQTTDFDAAVTGRCYRDFKSLKPWIEEELPVILGYWKELLGSKEFMTCGRLTVADLKLYETFRKIRLIEQQPEIGTGVLGGAPEIQAYMQRIEAIPAMSAYLKSASYMERPLNNVHAQFK
jgi:glutathione S-transferase